VRDRAPATPTELVHATDTYVGPAREPAVPHRAPGWLRGAMTPMQVPDFATGLPPALARMPVRPGPPDLPVPPALAPTAPPSPAAAVPARTEPVPPSLVHDLRAAHGVDLSDVPVRRGPDVDGTAEQLGAKAYTTDAEVHLPASAGETTGPEARALVAHELVHVAQQRDLGGRLPDESSPEGAVLEAEAAAVGAAV